MRSIIVVATLVAALVFPGVARAQSSADPIAFVGLRPTDDAAMKTTAIKRLTEAQAVRQVTENVISAISGRTVAGHEQLRELLGTGYLVSLVDCGGERSCILDLVRPLASRGYKQIVVGDYYVDPTSKQYRFRISLYQLDGKRAPVTANFTLPDTSVEDAKAWQVHLDPMFANRGKLKVVSNVTGFRCTIDGKPCELGADQVIALPAGEHVIELSKEGYGTRSRVVAVETGKSLSVGIGLDPLPVQASVAPNRLVAGPDPSQQGVTVFGRIQFGMVLDNVSFGDTFSLTTSPAGANEWNLSFVPTPSFIGVNVAGAKKPGELQVRGLIIAGVISRRSVRFPILNIDLIREDLGLKISLGRLLAPTVNSVSPGTLIDQGDFGSLDYASLGARMAKTFGPILVEVGAGRPELISQGEITPRALSLAQVPYAEGRVAYLDPKHKGTLYGSSTPLMLGISGAVGLQRVGIGEADAVRAAAPDAVDPEREDLPSWIGSAELLVPFGDFVLAGEAYVGQGAGVYAGALYEPAQIDPTTGRHTQLRSAGGWAQLSYIPRAGMEALVVAGVDRVYSGFRDGSLSISGSFDSIESNRLVAAVLTQRIRRQLRIGLQVHYRQTKYRMGDDGISVGGIIETQFNF